VALAIVGRQRYLHRDARRLYHQCMNQSHPVDQLARLHRSSGETVAAPSIAELYARAVGQHRAGFLREGEGLYRRVLAIDQRHADSLYNLGVLGLQIGRANFGVEMIAKAIARNDRVPEWHYNLAFGLAALGRDQDAIAHYRRAVALTPDYAEAHMNLGNALKAAGQLDQAIASYQHSTTSA
jgi:tetratricopeptide (TPR) repeat protein